MKEPNIYNTLIPDIFNLQKTTLKIHDTFKNSFISVVSLKNSQEIGYILYKNANDNRHLQHQSLLTDSYTI